MSVFCESQFREYKCFSVFFQPHSTRFAALMAGYSLIKNQEENMVIIQKQIYAFSLLILISLSWAISKNFNLLWAMLLGCVVGLSSSIFESSKIKHDWLKGLTYLLPAVVTAYFLVKDITYLHFMTFSLAAFYISIVSAYKINKSC